MSAADQIVDRYRRNAADWIRARQSQGFPDQPCIDRFRRELASASSILDLGCGPGVPVAVYLASHGHKLTGVDPSLEMLSEFHRNLPERPAIHSDMRDLHVPDRFDAVIAWNSFFHLTANDQRLMFAQFDKLAARSAVLAFTSGPRAGEAIGELGGEELYHASLDPGEYTNLLAGIGFDVVHHAAEQAECGGLTTWIARR